MYSKIKNFAENCWENRIMFRIFLVAFVFWFIVGCIIAAVQGNWETMFVYPEDDYVKLQNEADRIIISHSFDTSYELQITNYSNRDHCLSFDLRGDNSALLTVTVKNYGVENEEITYKRFAKSPISYSALQILAILLVIALFALLSLFAILIMISIIWFVSFLIHKIIEHSDKKSNKDPK